MIRGKGTLLGPVALAILASLALAAPAGADQIAYNCGGDVCVIDPDNPGSNVNLTETAGASETFPVFSPDGGRIAFRGLYAPSAFETWNVYTLDPAEPAPREVVNVSQQDKRVAYNTAPQWSPDGTRLAWGSEQLESSDPLDFGVFVGAAAGNIIPFRVGSHEGNFPAWSPDGATIAFSGAPESVYTASAAGPGPSAFLPGGAGLQPVFSPNGKQIAALRWTSPNKVRIINADGSGGHELLKPADLGTTIGWSPDSARVVYVNDEISVADQVWVAPVDGSSIGHAIPMPSGWIVPHNPSFSPDGTRVAFTARNSVGPGHEQILVAPADGSAAAAPITSSAMQNEQPSWKPGPYVPKPPAGGGGSGGSGGSGGGAGGSVGVTHTPVKLKLSVYKEPRLVGGGYKHMLLAGVDCKAQGGNPTGVVAEICAANANAYPTAWAPAGRRPWARAKAKPPLFAKGSVRVPAGKSKPLKLKITAAGKKMLKPGKSIKLKVTVTSKRTGAKPTVTTKTVTLKVPAK